MSIGKIKIDKVKINDAEIDTQSAIKYLGIVIDEKLLFKQLIEYLKSKNDKLIMRIKRMCWLNGNINMGRKMKLYFSVFIPNITYGHPVWYNSTYKKKTYLNDLNQIQNNILRAITGCYKNTNINKLLEIMKVIKLTDEMNILRQANETIK